MSSIITGWEGSDTIYIDNIPYKVTAKVIDAKVKYPKFYMIGANIKTVKKTPDGRIDWLSTAIDDNGKSFDAIANAPPKTTYEKKEYRSDKATYRPSEAKNFYASYSKDIVIAFIEKGKINNIEDAKNAWADIFTRIWTEINNS